MPLMVTFASSMAFFMVRTRVPEDAYVDTMSGEEFRHVLIRLSIRRASVEANALASPVVVSMNSN